MNSPLFTGKKLVELKETGSTNAYATGLLKTQHPPEGTAIFAYHQVNGKGQENTAWESDLGKNILTSIIYYPTFLAPDRHFLLNMTVALAIKDFFDLHISEGVRIKWPNDIYYFDRKLGGILIQNSITAGQFKYTVVGLGLNINQEQFPMYLPNPISLKIVTHKQHNLHQLLEQLFACLESRYLHLKQVDAARLKDEYERNLYRKGQEVSFIPAYEHEMKGKIEGVEPDGRLRISTENGVMRFGFKEVAFPL